MIKIDTLTQNYKKIVTVQFEKLNYHYKHRNNKNKHMTFTQHAGMFLLGLKDSVSPTWIKRVLLYVDPQTKKVHPSSKVVFDSLKSSVFKILLYTIIVPHLFSYFDFLGISSLFKIVYLILTYGYLFFYNNDILVSTQKLLAWQEKRQPNQYFELDKVENIEFFTLLSGQIKGFIFLLFYYVPIFLIETQLLTSIPYLGTFLFILSESFFNGVFYYMKTWPFDKYNIGFMEKNMAYMLGYGFTVSVVCNYFLSGSLSTGAYLIISLWMLINSVVYSPPLVQFKTKDDIIRIFLNSNQRKQLGNAYNDHRRKIRRDPKYREEIVKSIFLVYPALKITSLLNLQVSKWINNYHQTSEPQQSPQEQTEASTDMTSSNQFPSVIKEVEQEKEQSSPNLPQHTE